jgi:predicted DNA-binding protein (MmcQ/YjbR family)
LKFDEAKMTVPELTGVAADLREFALSLPETTEEFPWGETAFKVKSKVFVFLGMHEGELSFSVKLPQTGNQALALPFAEPTHYGLGRHGWVTIRPKGRVTKTLKAQIHEWIVESYRAVAPAKLAKALRV